MFYSNINDMPNDLKSLVIQLNPKNDILLEMSIIDAIRKLGYYIEFRYDSKIQIISQNETEESIISYLNSSPIPLESSVHDSNTQNHTHHTSLIPILPPLIIPLDDRTIQLSMDQGVVQSFFLIPSI